MYSITIATMNCHGQSKLEIPKQLFIQNFLLTNKVDILLCQETKILENTFNQCSFINSNYSIIKNNSTHHFGTSILVHNNIKIDEIKFDTEGRVIIFNSDNITIGNAYPRAGTDSESRQEREDLINTTIPNMLLHHKPNLILGGNWNCITENKECTNFPEHKKIPNPKETTKPT